MDTSKAHAEIIEDELTQARLLINEAIQHLSRARSEMIKDYFTTGDDDNVADTIAVLRVSRKNVIVDEDRWNGYANARKV